MSTDRPRDDNLRDAVENAANEMRESEENALEALKQAEDSRDDLHTVTLTGGIEVTVTDTIPGNIEKKAQLAEEKYQRGELDDAIDSVVEVMCYVIQTDGFDSRDVWRQYYQEYGSTNLIKCMIKATDPYFEQQQELEQQRQFRNDR